MQWRDWEQVLLGEVCGPGDTPTSRGYYRRGNRSRPETLENTGFRVSQIGWDNEIAQPVIWNHNILWCIGIATPKSPVNGYSPGTATDLLHTQFWESRMGARGCGGTIG